MVVFAILNGLLAQRFLLRLIGDYPSHLYRTFSAVAVVFLCSRVYISLATAPDSGYLSALSVGLLWLASSLLFEFGFGGLVMKIPYDKFMDEYDITRGRLWSLVLISEAASPLVNAWLLKTQ